jgi:DNA polymerase-3 subunit epsilon
MNVSSACGTISTLNPDNLVFLDLETTGLSALSGAKICEIAMLKVSLGQEETFESLVNPLVPIPAACSAVHAIFDNMVCDKPPFKDIAKDVANFIGTGVLVCHNAPFDLSFMRAEFSASGIAAKLPYIDTLKIARQYFNFDSNKLGAIAAAIGCEVDLAHRAMADVLTMKTVFKYLFNNLYRKGIDCLEINYFESK